MKKSGNTNAFFPILFNGAKDYKWYLGLGLLLDLNLSTGTAGTGSDIQRRT